MAIMPETWSLAISKIVCPQVDIDAFRKSCRAPLYRDRWNVWTLLRSLDDSPTISQMEKELGDLFGCDASSRNFVRTDPWFRDRGRVQGLTLGFFLPMEDTPQEPPALVDWAGIESAIIEVTQKYQGQTEVIVSAKLSDQVCAGAKPPPGNYTMVTAAFVYRGSDPDIPWPVSRRIRTELVPGGALGLPGIAAEIAELDIYCPENPRWILSDVIKPSPEPRNVPAPRDSVGDACQTDEPGFKWGEVMAHVIPGGARTIEAATDAMWFVGIAVAIAAGVYVISQ